MRKSHWAAGLLLALASAASAQETIQQTSGRFGRGSQPCPPPPCLPAPVLETPGVTPMPKAGEPGAPASELTLEVDANPASRQVGVRFRLPEAAAARLVLYDVTGREVAVVTEGERPAGMSSAVLDASIVAPGVYVLRLTAGDAQVSRTITIAR